MFSSKTDISVSVPELKFVLRRITALYNPVFKFLDVLSLVQSCKASKILKKLLETVLR